MSQNYPAEGVEIIQEGYGDDNENEIQSEAEFVPLDLDNIPSLEKQKRAGEKQGSDFANQVFRKVVASQKLGFLKPYLKTHKKSCKSLKHLFAMCMIINAKCSETIKVNFFNTYAKALKARL